MLRFVHTFTRKLCYAAAVVGITGSLLLSSAMPTFAQPVDPTVVDPTTVESVGKAEPSSAGKVDAAPVEKVVVASLEKAGAEMKEGVNAELVEKTFANDGKASLAEAVAASTSATQAKYGFNVYVQCWGDGHIHIRAFDDYGNFYYLTDSVFGDIATSATCSGGEWSVKVW